MKKEKDEEEEGHLRCVVSIRFEKAPPAPLASGIKGWDTKRVTVQNVPLLSAMIQLHQVGLNPLVVQFVPGGEEEKTLRTATTLSLASPVKLYPPAPNWGLYVPSVLVLQNDKAARFKCSILTLCATRKSEITAEGLFRTKGDTALAESRIWKLFSVAREWNHDSVLIGEWGCEGKDGPIDAIPRLFAKGLQAYGWTKHFKSIVFLARTEKTRQFWETTLHPKDEEEEE